MDNLARDVREAERLGYGCHYGRYKVDHPHTADHSVAPDLPGSDLRKCAECGAEFMPTRGNQRYCTENCKLRSNQYSYYRRAKERKLPLGYAFCPVCGETFDRKKRSQVYCSRSCAASENNRNRAKKKRETNSAG